MSKKLSKIWVDSDFKRFIKTKAAENDMTIIDYTKSLVNEEEVNVKNKKKKLEFFF